MCVLFWLVGLTNRTSSIREAFPRTGDTLIHIDCGGGTYIDDPICISSGAPDCATGEIIFPFLLSIVCFYVFVCVCAVSAQRAKPAKCDRVSCIYGVRG